MTQTTTPDNIQERKSQSTKIRILIGRSGLLIALIILFVVLALVAPIRRSRINCPAHTHCLYVFLLCCGPAGPRSSP